MAKKSVQLKDIKKQRSDEIVTAALKVFCEKGYEGATVDDIASKAGCSHGLFYHYFKSKRAIFDAVMSVRAETRRDEMLEKIATETLYANKLKVIITSIYDNLYNNENYAYFFYFFVSQCFKHKDSAPPKKKFDETPESPPKLLENLFKDGIAAGEFSDKYTPRECTELFISLMQGSSLNYVIAPKEMKKTMRLPNPDFIIDIYVKGDRK